MFQTIKVYFLTIFASLAAIFGALFLYERNKAKIDDALIQNNKINADLDKKDAEIEDTNSLLNSEEEKRKALDSEAAKDNSSVIDLLKYFNNRK